MTAPDAAGWRDISSAPRDGTRILLCKSGFQPAIGSWYRLQDRGDWGTFPTDGGAIAWWICGDPEDFPTEDEFLDAVMQRHYNPDVWQPLPAPPEGEG